jgi:hypothetical protein
LKESKDAPFPVTLRVNGKKHDLRIDPRTTLLDCLREHLHLTGSKKGCDHGQCGACTVHINGRRVLSCLCFAAMHEGDEITTIEGIGQPENLHPMQAAFVDLRCLSMRLLHIRADHVGGGALERTVRAGGRGGEGIHERQYLPLRRVSEHRRRDSECAAKRKPQKPDENFRTHAADRQRASNCHGGKGENRATGRGDSLHRRRHDADRFDEAERRAAAKRWSMSTGCRSTKSKRFRTAA